MKFEHEDYFNFNPIEAYEPQGQLSANETKQKSLNEPLESAVASEPFIPFSSTSPARGDYLRANAEPFSPSKPYNKRMLPSHHSQLHHRTYSHQPRYGQHHAHQYERPVPSSSSSRYPYSSSSSRKYDAYHHPATLLRDRSQSNSSSWAQVAKKDDEGQRRRSYEAPVVTVTSPEIQMYNPYSPQLLSGSTKSSGTSEELIRSSQSPPLPKFFQKLCGPSSGSAGRRSHHRRDEYSTSQPPAVASGRAGSTQPTTTTSTRKPTPHYHPGTIGGSRSRSHDRFSTTMTSTTTTTKIIAQPIDKKGSFPEEIACVLDNTPSRSLEQPAKLRHVNTLETYVKDNLPNSIYNARTRRQAYKKTQPTTSTRHSENYHRKSPKNSKKSTFHLQPVRTNKMYQRRQSPYSNDNQKNTNGHSLSHSSSPSPSAHTSNNTHLYSENHINQIRTRRMHTDATKTNTMNNNNNRFWNSNTNNSHANAGRNMRFDSNNGRTMRYENNRVNTYHHRYSKSQSSSSNFTKPHQVRYAVMCVSSLCDGNKIKLSSLVCGDNVLKIAIRSSAQLENIEETMKTLIGLSGITVEEVSVPSVETVTKRKRGFLIFMKLKNDIGVETVTELFATNGFKVNTVNNLTVTDEAGENTTSTVDEVKHTPSGTVVPQEAGLLPPPMIAPTTNSDDVSASSVILATISNLQNSISADPSSPKPPTPTVELNPPPRLSEIQTQTMLTGTPKKSSAHKLTITVPSDLVDLETEECQTDGTVREEDDDAEETVCVPGTPLAMEYTDVMMDETTKSDESFESVEDHEQDKPTTFSSEKMIENNEEVLVVPVDPSFGTGENLMINYQPSRIDAILKVTTNAASPTLPPPKPHELRIPAIFQQDVLAQQKDEDEATSFTTPGGDSTDTHHPNDENLLYSSSKRRSCNSFATFDDFDFEDSDQEPTLAFTTFEDEQKKKRKRRKRKKSKKHRPVQPENKDVSDYLPQMIGGCFAALVLAYLYN